MLNKLQSRCFPVFFFSTYAYNPTILVADGTSHSPLLTREVALIAASVHCRLSLVGLILSLPLDLRMDGTRQSGYFATV